MLQHHELSKTYRHIFISYTKIFNVVGGQGTLSEKTSYMWFQQQILFCLYLGVVNCTRTTYNEVNLFHSVSNQRTGKQFLQEQKYNTTRRNLCHIHSWLLLPVVSNHCAENDVHNKMLYCYSEGACS